MGKEIERKFLVNNPAEVIKASFSADLILQGYLSRTPERTVRVRLRGGCGYLTVKGLTSGAERQEWEYEIPAEDAREMLALCSAPIIDKTRHLVNYGGHTWEVDEFRSPRPGLWLAEAELKDSAEALPLPPWIGKEVTGNPDYYNSSLTNPHSPHEDS